MVHLLTTLENAHDDGIWSVQWTKNGRLVSGSVDTSVKLWAGSPLAHVHSFKEHELGVLSVVVDNTQKRLATSSLDSRIKIWDLDSFGLLNTIDCGPVEVWTLAASPTRPHVATGTHAGNLHLFDLDSCEKIATLETKGKFIMSVAYVRAVGLEERASSF
ncbi:hypothetical protein HMI54_006028 [Coelomomyces lativittatus]|nr:hypothetical protein HMI56_004875 [Coelomomyces lativittatus]KAJ1517324.1 hypothetical protein HMI54_006028 [Coelomomyces lativittatus]